MDGTKIFEELSIVNKNTLESVIKIADKYHLDRDNLLKEFAYKFAMVCELGTFKDYEIEEGE